MAKTSNGTTNFRYEQVEQDSKDLVRAFANQNIVGLILINTEGVVKECNQLLEEIMGVSSDEIIGMKAWDLQMLMVPAEQRTPETTARVKKTFLDMIQTGVIPEYIASNESKFHRKDGAEIFVEQNLFAVKVGSKHWIGSVVRDTTERKQAERRIHQQAAHAEALAALSNLLGQVTRDYQLVLDTVVRQCAELIGDGASVFLYSPESEVLELAAVYNPDPEAVEIFTREMQAHPIRVDEGRYKVVIDSRQPVLVPFIPVEQLIENASPDRRAYYQKLPIHSMMLAPLLAQGKLLGILGLGRHVPGKDYTPEDLTFLQDMANRSAMAMLNAQIYKELEQELQERQRLIAELEEKNAELERFTYTVSHDLKAPLVTIRGFLGYLEQDAKTGNVARLQKDAQRIANAVDKMNHLLRDLLELSRTGRMMNEPKDIALEIIIKDALEIVHEQLEDQNIKVHIQAGLPTIHGDHQRLTEVLQNLIDNAAKYMGGQTEPLIEIGQQGEEDGKPVFFVRDNGIGISPEYHERIFGLFNKLDAISEGTGIGLALVKRIIEFHGGRIWVQSEAGEGSTFYFTLPRG